MDKQTLKTTVEGLKPAIKQAKVHTINNLSRQAIKIKKKKTQNDAQKEKNIKKSDRFTTEIKILKNVGHEELAKFVLQNEKAFEEVKDLPASLLPNSSIDLKERAFVRIADFGKVKSLITEFRSKFPKWKDGPYGVSKLIKVTENQKQKKKEAKKKAQLKKKVENKSNIVHESSKANTTDDIDISESKCEKEDSDDEDNSDVEEDGSQRESECGDEEMSDKDDGQSDDEETSDEDEKEFRDYSSSEGDEEAANSGAENASDSDNESEAAFVTSLRNAISLSKGKNMAPEGSESKPKAMKEINKKEGDVLIKVLNLKDGTDDNASSDSDDESDSKPNDESNNNVEDKDGVQSNKKTAKVKSSFFLGGKSDSEEEEEEEDSVPFGEDVIQKRRESLKLKFDKDARDDGGFRRGGGRGRGHEGRGRGGFRGRGSFGGHEMSRGSFRGRGGVGSFRGRGGDFRGRGRGKIFSENNSSNENLHPSWAAKRKVNNPGVVEFQGKKTKFSDDPAPPQTTKPPGNQILKPAGNPSATSEKIHPSWAAKQNIQKPVIQSFQGKKITFD